MNQREVRVSIEHADAKLMDEVKRIARTKPTSDEVAILAKAILSVEEHCASVEAALTTLITSAVFTGR